MTRAVRAGASEAVVGSNGLDAWIATARRSGAACYRELPAPADLSWSVACTWIHVVGRPALPTAIVPDGCADVIAIDEAAALAVGPDAQTRTVALGDATLVLGVRLRPGAARAVFGCPAHLLLGETVALVELADRDPVLPVSPAARLEALLAWVRRRVARIDGRDRALVAALRSISATGQASIDELARGLGWHVRTLHRTCVAACGYGPKHLHGILRVQRIARLARTRPRARLVELALAAGFADQAHMSREVRKLTGFTAAHYLARSESDLGRWLDG